MTADKLGGAGLHFCGKANPVRVGTPVERLPWTTVDVHCHLAVPEVQARVAGHEVLQNQLAQEAREMGDAARAVNAAMLASLLPRLTSVEVRLADMDAMGVDIQLVSPSPTQYYYWAEQDLAAEVVELTNRHVADLCAAHPDRFAGLGTVAMQHPELAAAQLETAMRDYGFKGVEISTLVEGRDIADRYFDPFWQKADELGAVVFIHPWGTTMGTRLAEHYLMNVIGQPLETTICLSKLIFGGTLDRHRRLKIIAAHGGGYLPAYTGRSDHAHAVRPDAGGCACTASDYLQRIWHDSVVYEPRQLRRLVEDVGIGQVLLGTDYPFDMGHYAPARLLECFSEADQRKIAGENALALLGLSPASVRPRA